MDITYFSIILFLIITIIYFIFPAIGKIPPETVDKITDNTQGSTDFQYTNYIRLGVYFMGILISQFIVNAVYIVNYCGGNNSSNYGSAFLITFVPWIFIFGIMLLTLLMFPGFKSSFSDIIGYFIVANTANSVLNKILFEEKVNHIIATSPETDNIDAMKKTAENIMKLYSNKAIIINQIVPENFVKTWETLKPLMREGVADNVVLQKELLDVVVLRDNIGEAVWYIYTALVVISIVSYKIASRDCQVAVFDVAKQAKNTENN